MKAICAGIVFAVSQCLANFVVAQEAQKVSSPEAYAAVASIYEYNAKARFKLDTVATFERPSNVVQKLVLTTDLGAKIPFYLATPTSNQPRRRVVMLVHAYHSSKDWWFDAPVSLADSLLAAGYAVVALDAPYHGDRSSESSFRIPTNLIELRNMGIQWTIEHRRVLDLLSARGDLDVDHTAVVGYSMGTSVAFALGAIEPRVTRLVAAVTPIGGPLNPSMVTIDPRTFVPHLHAPLLMLMGTRDNYYTSAEARALYDQITIPKDLVFFESGHELPAAWVSNAVSWLAHHDH